MFHMRQWQCLVAVAETGSFQRAARRLGITPSGLTQSIQRLEHHYGRPLFHRRRSGITLTPAGEIAVEGGRAILRRAEAVGREMELASGPATGHLRVGVDPTLANVVLAPILADFLDRHPALRFSVTSDNRPTLSAMLAGHDIDLLIGYPDPDINLTGFKRIELTLPSPIVVARPGHPVTRFRKRNLSRYLVFPRLGALLPAWYVSWAEYQLAREGKGGAAAQDYYLYCNDVTLMKSVVQRSDALMGLFPEDAAAELASGLLVEVNPADWPTRAPLELLHTDDRALSRPFELFLAALVNSLTGR